MPKFTNDFTSFMFFILFWVMLFKLMQILGGGGGTKEKLLPTQISLHPTFKFQVLTLFKMKFFPEMLIHFHLAHNSILKSRLY